MYSSVMATMSVSEARAALPDVLDRVAVGEEVTITRHGRPVAVVVRPDALRARRADQALAHVERLRELFAHARSVPLPDEATVSDQRSDALAATVAASRAPR